MECSKDIGIRTPSTWNFIPLASSCPRSGSQSLGIYSGRIVPGNARLTYTIYMCACPSLEGKQGYCTKCHWILLLCLNMSPSCTSCGNTSRISIIGLE
ncbi:chlorophyllide a oxygenase, chloroplastic [Iris pallida]|uniref:Chlorophyllide a oxygenase, chloroplastic n=1 Tax=Iris pallida TaxID=29817 RepID=A0AAX6DIX3_IRIPA|nr:chlorophyllide a oxygenase, chloroplastic [Iris pallida]